MNVDQRVWWAGAILLATTNMFPAMAPAADVVTKFQETDETFANPGQGWKTTRRLPDGSGRFPYSVAYFRLNWEDLEPVEGQYRWQLIDEPLEAWAKRDARIAFRIMTTNAHSKGYYCSPKWLFDAGCKSYEYVVGGADITSGGARITRIEPDYGDPLYMDKHGRFIKALAERYDGNPQIEFIDIGSYGIWGEWHTKHPQPWPVRKQIIDMYLDGFHKTSLASMSDDAEAVPKTLREQLELAPFYQKHITVAGFPIVGSARVSDHALREAAWIVRHVVGERDDILQAMAANKVRLVVMAWDEYTTDVPEHSQLRSKAFWDRRARGLGATLHNPVVSCAEENLLCFPNDPYSTENILIHEFAHAIHGTAGQTLGADFGQRLQAAYKNATENGLFKDTYAGSNSSEYWAEAVQDWFDNNRENDSLHNHVNTRAELKAYDPLLAELVASVLGDGPWRYVKPIHRDPAERAHLTDLDPAKAPRFRWREAALVAKPQVLIQTTMGDIEVELDAERAPITTKNFLRYSLEGLYADGSFHRTVTLTNQPDDDVKIEVIQALANPANENERAIRTK